MLCPFTFLQGFKEISETVFKLQKGHMYMTWLTSDNVQRVVTPNANNSELLFLYFANCIMVIYLCIKFEENISNNFQVLQSGHKYITEINIFKVQRAITPKGG